MAVTYEAGGITLAARAWKLTDTIWVELVATSYNDEVGHKLTVKREVPLSASMGKGTITFKGTHASEMTNTASFQTVGSRKTSKSGVNLNVGDTIDVHLLTPGRDRIVPVKITSSQPPDPVSSRSFPYGDNTAMSKWAKIVQQKP